ncbi:MAG TPA: hypothetical protein VIE66_08065 [Methylocella sp.]|jgi:hypothetical protein
MSKPIFRSSKMQFQNQFGNARKVPQAEAHEVSTKQGCLDFRSPKSSIVTRLNDSDEEIIKIVFDETDKNCCLGESSEAYRFDADFYFCSQPGQKKVSCTRDEDHHTSASLMGF